jgi:8-oxo-dGTP pyrophosphatase MutT (NUDIX family)
MSPLKVAQNPFGGLVIEASDLPAEPAAFQAALESGLSAWKDEKIKVVWMTIQRSQAAFVPIAVEAGFFFHHTDGDALVLTHTLVPGSHIPPFATHYVGAGGVVLRENGDLLVVSEKFRLLPGRRLKLPGGALIEGEHISSAVEREVKEETGIDARFDALICLRHWHGYRYGKSDIYFVCRLTPLSFDIVAEEEEIAECFWMPHTDFLANEDVHPFNKRIVRAAISSPGISREYLDNYGTPETHELLLPPL